jgi:hypothetical protein
MSTPATTPLTFNGYINQIATMAIVNTQTVNGVVQGVDAAFNSIVPQMLNYAELRIERDLDLLPLETSNTYTLTSGSNILQLPVNDFVTVQTISVNNSGVNTPLLPTTKEFLQNVWGNSTTTGVPQYFAMYGGDLATGGNTYNNIIFGPYSSGNYPVTVTGTIRMPTLYANSTTTPLFVTPTISTSGNGSIATINFATQSTAPVSGTLVTISGVTPAGYNGTYPVISSTTSSVTIANTTTGNQSAAGVVSYASTTANTGTTFISTYLPDMLIMASMVYISAYQRNFGRMSDDPAMAQSYEGQYQALLRGAVVEEYRKKFEASAWSSKSPAPPATPVRT